MSSGVAATNLIKLIKTLARLVEALNSALRETIGIFVDARYVFAVKTEDYRKSLRICV